MTATIVRLAVISVALSPGCARPAAVRSGDRDGCRLGLAAELERLDETAGEALERIIDAPSEGRLHVAVTGFLRLRAGRDPGPEVLCQVKAALIGSKPSGAVALDAWRYWSVSQVYVDGCTDADFDGALRHITDLRLLAEARNDVPRVHDLDKQREHVERDRRNVVRFQLCPDPVTFGNRPSPELAP